MNSIRTTVTLPEVVLKHIQDSLKDGDTLKSFFERAVINQLEKEGDSYQDAK
jgi:hypothetical protein